MKLLSFLSLVLLALSANNALSAEYPAITRSPITLCRAPGEGCAANTFQTSTWGGCRGEPKGCYLRSFDMQLPKGDVVRVVARDRRDAQRDWVFLKARWCIPGEKGGCDSQFSGWARRSRIAYFDEFKRMASWPGERSFQIEAGDYAEVFRVNQDASFSLSDGERGTMFVNDDIVWARLRGRPTDTQFIFTPGDNGKHCWTTSPEEEAFGDERWNCFTLRGSPAG